MVILDLITRENEALLIWRDILLVLEVLIEVINCVTVLDLIDLWILNFLLDGIDC